MRPVTKWEVPCREKPGLVEDYDPYTNAKPLLEENIGTYCSYCERRIEDEAMHVEHVQPKAAHRYPHLIFKWSNFLVSCSRCNGQDNKADKDVVFNDIHLPHKNNTITSIKYLDGGKIVVNDDLSPEEIKRAQNLIDLVGLDKTPNHPDYKKKDKRWRRRFEVWILAEGYLVKFQQGEITPQVIVDLALAKGYWSVWMTIFSDYPDILNLLISEFPGTYLNCLTE